MIARRVINLCALLLGLLLGGFTVNAFAVLNIGICGSADYECPAPISLDDVSGFDNFGLGASAGSVALTGESGAEARIPLSPAAVKVPDGWQDSETPPATALPTDPGGDLGPVERALMCDGYAANACGAASKDLATCQAWAFGGDRWCMVYYVGGDSCSDGYAASNSGVTTCQELQDPQCPVGYTYAGSTCNLTDPAVVQKPSDSECGLVKADGFITMDVRDPDCSGTTGSAAMKYGLTCVGGVCESRINNVAVEVSSSVAGGGDQIKVSKGNGDGTTTIGTWAVSAPGAGSSGTVTGKSASTVQGEGSLITETPATGGGGTGGGDGTMNCPDCAKETTLQDVRDWLVEPMPDSAAAMQAGTDSFNVAADSAQAQIESVGDVNRKTDLGFLWSPEFPGGACVPIEFGTDSYVGSWDFCDELEGARSIWGWAVMMLAGFYVWRSGTSLQGGR